MSPFIGVTLPPFTVCNRAFPSCISFTLPFSLIYMIGPCLTFSVLLSLFPICNRSCLPYIYVILSINPYVMGPFHPVKVLLTLSPICWRYLPHCICVTLPLSHLESASPFPYECYYLSLPYVNRFLPYCISLTLPLTPVYTRSLLFYICVTLTLSCMFLCILWSLYQYFFPFLYLYNRFLNSCISVSLLISPIWTRSLSLSVSVLPFLSFML